MITISKSKPDVVHVHRIELQKKERELIESAVAAYNFKKYADPFVAGFSDVSFLLAVGTLLTLGSLILYYQQVKLNQEL